jgi:hypothetical protein
MPHIGVLFEVRKAETRVGEVATDWHHFRSCGWLVALALGLALLARLRRRHVGAAGRRRLRPALSAAPSSPEVAPPGESSPEAFAVAAKAAASGVQVHEGSQSPVPLARKRLQGSSTPEVSLRNELRDPVSALPRSGWIFSAPPALPLPPEPPPPLPPEPPLPPPPESSTAATAHWLPGPLASTEPSDQGGADDEVGGTRTRTPPAPPQRRRFDVDVPRPSSWSSSSRSHGLDSEEQPVLEPREALANASEASSSASLKASSEFSAPEDMGSGSFNTAVGKYLTRTKCFDDSEEALSDAEEEDSSFNIAVAKLHLARMTRSKSRWRRPAIIGRMTRGLQTVARFCQDHDMLFAATPSWKLAEPNPEADEAFGAARRVLETEEALRTRVGAELIAKIGDLRLEQGLGFDSESARLALPLGGAHRATGQGRAWGLS